MSEPTTDLSGDPEKQPPASDTTVETGKPPRRAGVLSGRLALILSISAVIASGYMWYTLFYEKQELLDSDLPSIAARLGAEVDDLRKEAGDIGAEITALRETQDTLKAAVEKTESGLGRNRAEWVLAETEQLLLIASHRLQLAHDVETALSALRTADRHLQELANPSLLPVRKLLTREISQLESLGSPDTAGQALRLGELADSVDRMPLAIDTLFRQAEMQASREQEKTSDTGGSFTRQIWSDLRSLVRIQDNVQTQKPLLPPEQRYFLRQNLRLMLNGAQLALLRNDVATYRQNIGAARQWVTDYFDLNTQVVLRAQKELDRLYNEDIVTDLPDISASLEALRKITGMKKDAP